MLQKRNVLLFGLLAVVVLVDLGHFQNGFHFDDRHTVVHNPYIRDLHNIPRFFTDARTFSIDPVNRSYRPIVSTTLALDYWFGNGLDPFYFHFSTFCLFLLQLVLMFAFFRRLGDAAHPDPRNRLVALFAVAWYGLHPAMAETVNYVIQRGDLYTTIAVVAGVLMYASGGALRKYGLYLLPVVLGILSKLPAVIFPAILFLYIYLFENVERRFVRPLVRSLPAFLVSGALAAFSVSMVAKDFNPGAVSAHAYRITQPLVALRYFMLFLLPGGLTADTDLQPVSSVWQNGAWAGFLFLFALIGAAVLAGRRAEWRPVSFGLWWFLLGLIPTSVYPLADVENHHRLFLPFVGLVIAASWPVALWICHVPPRRMVRIGLGAVCAIQLVVLSLGTLDRNRVWRNDESLWYDVTLKSPHDSRGLLNYAVEENSRGRFETAISYLEAAKREPAPPLGLIESNLGQAYDGLKHDAEAELHLRTAIAMLPRDQRCRTHYATWLANHNREKEAIEQLGMAIQVNPDALDSVYLLMKIYARRGQWAAIQRTTDWLLRRFPGEDNAKAYLLMAADSGQPDGNVPTQSLRTPENLVNLSALYYDAAQYGKGIDAAEGAVKLRPDYADAYDNVAACYRAAGNCTMALQAAKKAMKLRPNDQGARQVMAACR
jgi:tetratricopeptide (TPR) repeat protein